MVGRLLALCPIELDQFTLTKESLELVDEEFSQVIDFSGIETSSNLFVVRSANRFAKLKLVSSNLKNN